jgi:hypothetical protein
LRVIRLKDVVYPVAIRTYGAVVPQVGPPGLEYRDIHAMPREFIEIIDVSREAILAHQLRIGVTTSTKLRRFDPKLGRTRIVDVVDPMAIRAYWDVRVVFFD